MVKFFFLYSRLQTFVNFHNKRVYKRLLSLVTFVTSVPVIDV